MARISTYSKDANITSDDKLLGSNYGGLDNQGRPIFTTANFKIEDLLVYFSQNIDVGGGESLGELLEDVNKLKTFVSYDENGNITGISEAFVGLYANSEVADNYATATFQANVEAKVVQFDEDGNISLLSTAFANDIITATTTDRFATSQKVNNLGSAFGSFDGENFNLAEANIQSIFDTFTTLSFANSQYITNIESEVSGKPLVFRQDAEPTIYSGIDQVIPDGSIWYDTNDDNKVYIVADNPENAGTSIWILTEDSRIGASASKITNMSAKFGSFDVNNNFTIDTTADYFEAVKTYTDTDSAVASKVENLNATLEILDENGNVVKNSAQFLSDIVTEVDLNSSTAEKAENLRIEVEGDGTEGSGLIAQMSDVTTLAGDIDGYLKATRTINVDANGNIASMQLLADENSSEIRFTADSFKVYNGTTAEAPFEIVDNQVKIKSAAIQQISFGDLGDIPDYFVVTTVYADDALGTNASTTKGEKNFYGIHQGQTAWVDGDSVTGITFNQITGDTGATGAAGDPGAPGANAYFHVKYSDDNGATFTANDGNDIGDYIGTYTDSNETPSTDVNDYTWIKIIGQDGIQGPTGDRVYTTNLFYQTIVTDGSTPTFDTTNLTYDFSTASFSGIPTGWGTNPPSSSPGSGTNALFYVSVNIVEGTPNVITVGNPTTYFNFNGLVTFTGTSINDGTNAFDYTAINGAWITTGAIKSSNFTFTDADANSTFAETEAVTEGAIFDLVNGYIKTPKLWLTSDGDAFFSGQLSVGSGDGNVVIDDNGITVASNKFAVDTSGEVTLAGTITGSTGVFGDVTLNSDGISSTNFNIDTDGNVTIAGDITGSSGEFNGSLNVNDKFLVTSSGAVQVYAGGETLGSGGRFEILDESGNSKYRLFGSGINFNAWAGGSNAFNSTDALGGGGLFFSSVAHVYAGNGTTTSSNHGFTINMTGGSYKTFIKTKELRIDPASDFPTIHKTIINGDLEVLGAVEFSGSVAGGDVTKTNLETRLAEVSGTFDNDYNVYVGATGLGTTINLRNNLNVISDATIGNDLTVSGDLYVNGTTTTVNTSTLEVDDPLIYLAYNNETSDSVDIGFIGHYSPDSGTTRQHTGIIRSHTDGEYYIFDQYTYDEASNPTPDIVDIADASFSLAVVNVDTINGNLVGDVTGDLTGNVTGDVTGNVTGSAGSAASLTNPVLIGGVSFNGTADIDLPGVNTTGNQDTTGNAATVTDGVYLSADNTLSGINTFEGATHFEGVVDSVSSMQINDGSGNGFKGDIYRPSSATLVLDVSDSHLIGYADQLKNDVKVKLIGDITGEATLPGANPTATPDTIQISTSAGSSLKNAVFPSQTYTVAATNVYANIYFTSVPNTQGSAVTVSIAGNGKKVIAEIVTADNGEIKLKTTVAEGEYNGDRIDLEITQDTANPENYRLRVKGATSFEVQILDWDIVDGDTLTLIPKVGEADVDPVQNGDWANTYTHVHRCVEGTSFAAFKHTGAATTHDVTIDGSLTVNSINLTGLSSTGGRTTETTTVLISSSGGTYPGPIPIAELNAPSGAAARSFLKFTVFGGGEFLEKKYVNDWNNTASEWNINVATEESSGKYDVQYDFTDDKFKLYIVDGSTTLTYNTVTITIDHLGEDIYYNSLA